MKLVPFVLTQKSGSSLESYRWLVFLSHAGRGVWKTDEPGLLSEKQIRQDYLVPNGIYTSKVLIDKINEVAWIHVDTSKTNLSEFYTWEEALHATSKPECWRPFYFFKDEKGSYWWSGKGIECDAEIQELGNVADCFTDVLRQCT